MKVSAWLVIVAVLAVVTVLELTFGVSHLIGLALLRPSATSTPTPRAAPPSAPVEVWFSEGTISEIIFANSDPNAVLGLSRDNADGMWEQHGHHELALHLGQDKPLRFPSFLTRLWHLKRRPQMLYFYPFEHPNLTYADAVANSRKLLEQLRLADRIDWEEYTRELERKPIVPVKPMIDFPAAKLFLSLGCSGWDDALPLKMQLGRVSCYPDIQIETKVH